MTNPNRSKPSAFADRAEPKGDAIFELNQRFRQRAAQEGANPINLGVGQYQDERGVLEWLPAVKTALQRVSQAIVTDEISCGYVGIAGHPGFRTGTVQQVFGKANPLVEAGHVGAIQTLGGTGALALAAQFLADSGHTKILVSNPTWGNHPHIFGSRGLEVVKYPYLDLDTFRIQFDGLFDFLKNQPGGSAVLLHTTCHNPTGIDFTPEQWERLAQLFLEKDFFALFDFAYQGFGAEPELDAVPIRRFSELGIECLVALSFSKNAGLYSMRVGALQVYMNDAKLVTDPDHSTGEGKVFRALKSGARGIWSNPPATGAFVMNEIYGDPELHANWQQQLAAMRGWIDTARSLLVSQLVAADVAADYIEPQKGMFSYIRMAADAVDRLEKEHDIFAVKNAAMNALRINVAPVNEGNVDRVVAAFRAVI